MKLNNKSVKGHMYLECTYERITVDGKNQETNMHFGNKSDMVLNNEDFIKNNFDELISREQRFSPNKGSGWSLLRCEHLVLKLKKYNALNAGSYIELPKEIEKNKACINFKNKDEYCFIYSIRLAIDIYNKKTLDHPERVKQYKQNLKDNIFSEFDFPMKLDDITKFENKSLKKYDGYPSMSINVYTIGENNKTILPLRIS